MQLIYEQRPSSGREGTQTTTHGLCLTASLVFTTQTYRVGKLYMARGDAGESELTRSFNFFRFFSAFMLSVVYRSGLGDSYMDAFKSVICIHMDAELLRTLFHLHYILIIYLFDSYKDLLMSLQHLTGIYVNNFNFFPFYLRVSQRRRGGVMYWTSRITHILDVPRCPAAPPPM